MRAALYIRVSTRDQALKFGPASQRSELRALAAQKGYAVPAGGEFVDDEGRDVSSGARLSRPALDRLLVAVRAGLFDIVLVHDPDRFARKLVYQLLLLEECDRAGVRVEFLTTPREDTPEGDLLLNVKAVISEYGARRSGSAHCAGSARRPARA